MKTPLNRNHDSLLRRGIHAVRSLFRRKAARPGVSRTNPPSSIFDITPLPHISDKQLLDVNER